MGKQTTITPPPTIATARRWGRIADVPAVLPGVSDKTIRRMISRGEIYAERVGPRLIRVDLNSIVGMPLAATGDAA